MTKTGESNMKLKTILFVTVLVTLLAACNPTPTPTLPPEPTVTVAPPTPEPTAGYKTVKVVAEDQARLFYIDDWNDVGKPIFLPAVKDNGKPALVLEGAVLTVYTFDDSREDLKFNSDGSIDGDSGVDCYLISSGSMSSGLSAAGLFIRVEDVVDW